MPLAHILYLPPGAATFFVALFALGVAHAMADFALQGEFLAVAKNRHADTAKFFGEKGQPRWLWVHALNAHSLIHAGGVWLVTGSLFLGAVELVLGLHRRDRAEVLPARRRPAAVGRRRAPARR